MNKNGRQRIGIPAAVFVLNGKTHDFVPCFWDLWAVAFTCKYLLHFTESF